jgi:hypothetical protein
VVCKPYGFFFVFSTFGSIPSVDDRGRNFVPFSKKNEIVLKHCFGTIEIPRG